MGFFSWLKSILGSEEHRSTRQTDVPHTPVVNRTHAPQGRLAPQSPQAQGYRASSANRQPSPYSSSPPVPQSPPPSVNFENLDASSFAPISNAQASAMIASYGNQWKNAYLDSLSVIPDASLPRIQVIDRGMAGAGLISPEELAEIHETGIAYRKASGDYHLLYQEALSRVNRTLDERQRIKEQKKRESEERKAAHAEKVRQNKLTDIVFLGRGVSAELSDRRSNIEKLEAQRLPILSTPMDVAKAMEIEIPELKWLAYDTMASEVSHYIRFDIPKKNGKMRSIFAPKPKIAKAQHWILDHILSKVPTHEAAHGFVPGRSILSNAKPHVGRDVVINIDLKDFFPSVYVHRVIGLLKAMGYSPAVATILALICTERPRKEVSYAGQRLHVSTGQRALPQGACTSPVITNLIARRLDKRLAALCAQLGFSYTRYADDMSFSTNGEAAEKVGYLLARVRHIVQDEGFVVNEEKTRVLRQNTAQEVTGVIVNQRPGVPRKTVRKIRAILHNAKYQGLASQNREDHPYFESWLTGMIAYIRMVNPEQGEQLFQAYHELDRLA